MCCVSVFFQNYQCNFFECTHQKESFWSVILVIFLKHSKIGILWETNKQILFDGFKPFHFIPVPSAWTKTHLTQNCHLVWISLKEEPFLSERVSILLILVPCYVHLGQIWSLLKCDALFEMYFNLALLIFSVIIFSPLS